jgi:glycosyltransferase involved in cell wall biosynthesis
MPLEIIFVEDACPSGSLVVLQRLALRDSRVAVISLAQNVGQHRAVLIGLGYARGKSIVLLDADLQDPPEAIPFLLRGLNGGAAAVFAGRRGAYESIPRLASSFVFKVLLHLLAGVPADAGMFVAFDRRVADRLLAYRPRWPFVVAMIGGTGLPLASIPIRRDRRPSGRSAYTPWDRFRVGIQTLAWAAAWRLGAGSGPDGVPPEPVRAEIGDRFKAGD